MSRTSKFMAATVALLLGVTTLHAQSIDDSAGDDAAMRMMLENLQGGGDAADLRGQIRSRIDAILGQIDQSPVADTGDDPLTIKDIDQLNRSAERERTELEFEQARFERMQLEVERLMALYEAVKTIEEDEAAMAESRTSRMRDLMEMNDTGDDVDSSQMNLQSEQSHLPRLDSIVGMSGTYKAKVAFDDWNMREIEEGEQTNHGFIVDKITSQAVYLIGPMTGSRFRLTPNQPVIPQPQQGGNVQNAIDLSQFPMAQF